ncbi:TIGR03619 family F420-dependent LLM class oxidoreductase [Nitriliruptoraceae bacterium ZYF776]|nr:TIGR03619 family F420-dependent LLM class oxidoreductase [Profundirhabdus halotolerans]
MDVGVATFPTDRSWPVVDLARAVEERGLASLAVTEHTHIPVDHTPYPAGGPLPEEYHRTLDPLVALTAAATVTERLRLVTAVTLLAQHDPIVFAKSVASLDHLSGGRVTLGVGYGWNRPELEHHGVAFAARRDVVRDRLLAVRALWRDEVADVDLPHVRFAPSWSWPKPVQSGGPPVFIGAGLGPRTLADLVGVADGWMPMGGAATADGLPRLREAWDAAGREGTPRVHVLGANPAKLPRLADLGVDAVSLWLPSLPREEALPRLDAIAEAAAALP